MKNIIPDFYIELPSKSKKDFKRLFNQHLSPKYKASFINALLRDRSRCLSAATSKYCYEKINQILQELGLTERLTLHALRPDLWSKEGIT